VYQFMIEEMAEKIGKAVCDNAGGQEHEWVAFVREELREYWDDKIAVVWAASDVIDYYESIREEDSLLDMTDERACEILDSLLENHDANHGVSWDQIDSEVRSWMYDNRPGEGDEDGEREGEEADGDLA
jgi:hypothetical protein